MDSKKNSEHNCIHLWPFYDRSWSKTEFC